MPASLSKIITRAPAPFPKDIAGLTSLRFMAVLYVVLFHYHFKFHPAIDLIIAKGYLAVDFFFILSGFILTHCYYEALKSGTFSYRGFLVRRIARIYPVHLFTLLVMGLIFGVYALCGWPVTENAPSWSDFIQNILLIHSWGWASDLSFNRYSWTISAELMAYILFPALLLGLSKIKPVTMAVIAAALLYLILWLAAPPIWSMPLSQMAIFGLPRIIPEFILGISLYLFALRYALALHGGWFLAACVLAMIAGLLVGCGDWIAIPGFALVILATAEQSRSGKQGFLYDKSSVYLGEISYSLYMIQFPYVFILFDTVLGMGLEIPKDSTLWNYGWSASPILLLLLAMAVHKYIETPARTWTINRLAGPGR